MCVMTDAPVATDSPLGLVSGLPSQRAEHMSRSAREPSPNGMLAADRKSERKHLTVADVCDELGISRSTFYDWRAAKKAPNCIRLPNGSLRVRRTDLERWLTNREELA